MRPTWPRTSTFEKATVGVGGAPNPMNDRVRPLERKVDTRGVDKLGKGTGPTTFDISVIVEGVRVVSVGDGGKTNSVCEGVETMEGISETLLDAFRKALLRRCNGGGTSLRDSTRCRTGGKAKLVLTARG